MRVVRHGKDGVTYISRPVATTLMHEVCSWCKRYLGATEVAWSGEEEITSHDICQSCLDSSYPEPEDVA